MDEKYPDVLAEIKAKREIDPSIEEKLYKALNEFKAIFTN
jgi:hypothetical protein